MWFRSLFDSMKRRPPGSSARRRPRASWPQLEVLEDRRLLTLNPVVNYAVGANPLDVVVGDFSGDGIADLAAVNASQLSILPGNGNGTFRAAQLTDFGSGGNILASVLAAAHFNSDGRLDLARTSASGSGEGFVHILLNNGTDASGTVTFQPIRTFSTGANTTPGAIAVGDLNGDGRSDVVAAENGGANVTVLLGNGTGGLQTGRHFAVGANPGSVALEDFNGDNRLDIATANRGSGDVSLLLNDGNDSDGNVTFQAARSTAIYSNVESVAVGDLNADGNLDLAATSSVTQWEWRRGYYYYYRYYWLDSYVNVLLGNGDGTFAAPRTTWVNDTQLGDLAVADFNGDAWLDVVTADGPQTGRVDPTVLLGRGNGDFDAPYHFVGGNGPVAVAAADLTGDSAADVAVANFYAANVSVFINDRNWPLVGAPFVSITDVTANEGNTGTTPYAFTVSLWPAFSQPIVIPFSTADGSATAGSDYQATSGTLTFNPGETSKTITVLVNGDRLAEVYYKEHFSVNLSPSNARFGDSQGTGYISDDEPYIYIVGPNVTEGNTGTTPAVFSFTLASPSDGPVTVNWSTSDGLAMAGSDYQAASGMLTFNPGAPAQTVTVLVNGDRIAENNEHFYVILGNGYNREGKIVDDEPRRHRKRSQFSSAATASSSTTNTYDLSNPTNGTIESNETKYIVDDEPPISINNPSLTERNSGTRLMTFTVTLSVAYDQAVTVNFATADGSATVAGNDYVARSGRLIFAAGQTIATFTVTIKGDKQREPDGWFAVILGDASSNALIWDPNGYASILNDDGRGR